MNTNPSVLLYAMMIAASILGYAGINFKVWYDSGQPIAGAVLSSFEDCIIIFNDGFEYFEKLPPEEYETDHTKIGFLIVVGVHEFAHCQGVGHSGEYLTSDIEECYSIMNRSLAACLPQWFTAQDWRELKYIRDYRLNKTKISIPGISTDTPATPSYYERLMWGRLNGP